MARSKAWQVKQWQVETGDLTGVRYKSQVTGDKSAFQPVVTWLERTMEK